MGYIPLNVNVQIKSVTSRLQTLISFGSTSGEGVVMGGVYEELGGAKHPHGGSKVLI